MRELISTLKKKKKRRRGMNCQTFSPNPRTRGKSQHHSKCLCTLIFFRVEGDHKAEGLQHPVLLLEFRPQAHDKGDGRRGGVAIPGQGREALDSQAAGLPSRLHYGLDHLSHRLLRLIPKVHAPENRIAFCIGCI